MSLIIRSNLRLFLLNNRFLCRVHGDWDTTRAMLLKGFRSSWHTIATNPRFSSFGSCSCWLACSNSIVHSRTFNCKTDPLCKRSPQLSSFWYRLLQRLVASEVNIMNWSWGQSINVIQVDMGDMQGFDKPISAELPDAFNHKDSTEKSIAWSEASIFKVQIHQWPDSFSFNLMLVCSLVGNMIPW